MMGLFHFIFAYLLIQILKKPRNDKIPNEKKIREENGKRYEPKTVRSCTVTPQLQGVDKLPKRIRKRMNERKKRSKMKGHRNGFALKWPTEYSENGDCLLSRVNTKLCTRYRISATKTNGNELNCCYHKKFTELKKKKTKKKNEQKHKTH